jgi:hypothetical protein
MIKGVFSDDHWKQMERGYIEGHNNPTAIAA